jgi:predicted O-linked N-acetylglucosamine transferase (SPINDLY family)
MPTVAEVMALAAGQQQAGNWQEAERLYRLVLQVAPQQLEALHRLGLLTSELGRHAEAASYLEQAVRLRPDVAHFHANLGLVYQRAGDLERAAAEQEDAIRLLPTFAGAHFNLGVVRREQGRLDEALASYREAARLEPTWPMPLNNLAAVRAEMGQHDEAVAAYRQVCELQPDSAFAHSNLYYALHFGHGDDQELLAREHQRWYERHARPLEQFLRPHANDPDPYRRLRVGYVSTTFCEHPVARFLLPILECHDRAQFEVVCYSSGSTDPFTQRLRQHADQWRDVAGLSDERLTELIREERIDILVDLSMHVGFNRLLVFARKPAPVQVCYLAACSSTGLHTMDYRLSDPYLDPPDATSTYCSEETARLPESYWCYRPEPDLPPPGPLPAEQTGHVTFGCLNNFAKVTPMVLSRWREMMRSLPGSRLLLHARGGSHCDRVRQFFAEAGIEPDRIAFVGRLPYREYLRTYERIDLALDTFPYVGGTTTCDALWMGVPVVSLVGKAPQSRGGWTILSNVGLPELTVRSSKDYVQTAMALAGDLPRLASLRTSLRPRMEQSPLTDAPRFTRNLEMAFRTMWQRWCEKRER